MSTAVKLSLASKKDARDSAPRTAELLKDMSDLVGSSVTANFDASAVYAQLEKDGSDYKDKYTSIINDWLQQFKENIEYIYKKEAGLKDLFEPHWSTHNINFIVVDEKDFEKNYYAKKQYGGGSYWAVRLHEGELQFIAASKNFWTNTGNLTPYYFKWVDILPATASEGGIVMSASYKKDVLDKKAEVEEALKGIRAISGCEGVTFDYQKAAEKAYATAQEQKWDEPNAAAFPDYINQVKTLLEKQYGDELVKEAIEDLWSKKEITISYGGPNNLADLKEGLVAKGAYYAGVRLIDGKLDIIYRSWWSNSSEIGYSDFSEVL